MMSDGAQDDIGLPGVAPKLKLGRGGSEDGPWGSQFDAYRLRYSRTWRPRGYRNPLPALMRFLVRRQLG